MINDFEMSTLKTERVENKFLNLNSFEKMMKMPKTM
jgi:hypothetical protein